MAGLAPRPGCIHTALCDPCPGLFDQGLPSLPSVVLSDSPSAVWITFPVSLIAPPLHYSMELALLRGSQVLSLHTEVCPWNGPPEHIKTALGSRVTKRDQAVG